MNNLEKYLDHAIEQRPIDFEISREPPAQGTSELVTSILRRWYIALLAFFVICATGIPAIWFSIEPLYDVTGAIRVAPILPNILTGEADRAQMSTYQSFLNTQTEMITSNQVIQRVADDLVDRNLTFFESKPAGLITKLKHSLRSTKTTKPEPADMLKQAILDGVIEAVTGRGTELIRITMKNTNPEEAEKIVNGFIRAYMAVEVSSSAKGQDQKLSVLENERGVLAEKLRRQRETIRQLAQEYGTVSLDSRQDMMLQRVASLLAELTRIEARRINFEAQVELLEQTTEQTIAPADLLKMRQEYINKDPMVNVLTENIAQLDQEFIVATQTLASTNPELKRKADLLDALKTRLVERKEQAGKTFDDLMSRELASAESKKLINARTELQQTATYEKRLREILATEDAQTVGLGRKQLAIQDLQDQLGLTKDVFDTIRRRIQEAEMERKSPARVSVAYDADITSIRDKRIKYTMALLLGAVACGMLLAYLRDKADLSLRTPDEVAKRIGVRIIGTTTSPHAVKKELLPRQIAEDFQTIRANLGLLDGGGLPRKLVVTSPGMREGKTTFAINFATSLSMSGKKVLLIDGDLRKPDVAHLLNLPKGSRTLQDVLLGRKLDHAIPIPLTNLDVLPADSHNMTDACELLALPLTAQQINTFSQEYDHVIIDTPPVLAFPDALIWAKMAEAVILTTFAGQTTAPDLQRTKERLAEINVRVLGTILSNVQAERSYYRYGYNYYTQNARSAKNAKQANTKGLLLPAKESGKAPGDLKT